MKKLALVSAVAGALSTPALFAETTTNSNSSDWKGSFIVEGLYIDRSTSEALEIPGMPSGGHAHGLEEGLQAGHSELVVTGSITDKLNARFTAAILEGEEDGEAVTAELEEGYIATQGLFAQGFNVKAGRMYTDVGYLSNKHNHEWDFADQPLVYEGMFGEHAIGDGVQLHYLPATETYLQLGSELFVDEEFPTGETDGALSAATLYAKVGGDVGTDHSWLAGVGHWRAMDITDRSAAAHDHDGVAETPRFSGDSEINTVNALYKWAPNGNAKERNLKLQFEYFQRNEDGQIDMVEADGNVEETSTYNGDQSGWYLQGVYQFRPQWRVGLRHDRLKIDNTGSDLEVLEEAELLPESHTPQRNSIMVDYSPREYSRLRLQFNRDERSTVEDDQVVLQYIHSFGSHGAHAF